MKNAKNTIKLGLATQDKSKKIIEAFYATNEDF